MKKFIVYLIQDFIQNDLAQFDTEQLATDYIATLEPDDYQVQQIETGKYLVYLIISPRRKIPVGEEYDTQELAQEYIDSQDPANNYSMEYHDELGNKVIF